MCSNAKYHQLWPNKKIRWSSWNCAYLHLCKKICLSFEIAIILSFSLYRACSATIQSKTRFRYLFLISFHCNRYSICIFGTFLWMCHCWTGGVLMERVFPILLFISLSIFGVYFLQAHLLCRQNSIQINQARNTAVGFWCLKKKKSTSMEVWFD